MIEQEKDTKYTPIISIIGVGRSGTSLLQSMLNAHPDICFPPETHFFRFYLGSKRKKNKIEHSGPEKFLKLLLADKNYKRVDISPEKLLQPYLQGKKAFNLVAVYQRMLRMFATREGKSLIGDKDPRNIDHLYNLKSYLPNAFVLHLIRDPRDVLVSRMRAKWAANYPCLLHVLVCRAQLCRGRKLGKRLFGERYLEIFYENLITEPEKTLKGICHQLDVTYYPAMLHFNESAQKLVDASEMQWKKTTLGPLLRDNKGKWIKALSSWQIRLTETLCKEAMCAGGYKKAGKETHIGVMKAFAVLISRPIAYLFSWTYGLRNYL